MNLHELFNQPKQQALSSMLPGKVVTVKRPYIPGVRTVQPTEQLGFNEWAQYIRTTLDRMLRG